MASTAEMNKSGVDEDGDTLTVLDSRVPPAVHEVDARGFGQVQRDTSGLQADEEDSDVDIVHCIAIRYHCAPVCEVRTY